MRHIQYIPLYSNSYILAGNLTKGWWALLMLSHLLPTNGSIFRAKCWVYGDLSTKQATVNILTLILILLDPVGAQAGWAQQPELRVCVCPPLALPAHTHGHHLWTERREPLWVVELAAVMATSFCPVRVVSPCHFNASSAPLIRVVWYPQGLLPFPAGAAALP